MKRWENILTRGGGTRPLIGRYKRPGHEVKATAESIPRTIRKGQKAYRRLLISSQSKRLNYEHR